VSKAVASGNAQISEKGQRSAKMPGDMAFCLEESERDFSAREITLFA
jgi:hypothetical protein